MGVDSAIQTTHNLQIEGFFSSESDRRDSGIGLTGTVDRRIGPDIGIGQIRLTLPATNMEAVVL